MPTNALVTAYNIAPLGIMTIQDMHDFPKGQMGRYTGQYACMHMHDWSTYSGEQRPQVNTSNRDISIAWAALPIVMKLHTPAFTSRALSHPNRRANVYECT